MVSTLPISLLFAPYYGAGILSVFVHLGAMPRLRRALARRGVRALALPATGALLALVIVTAMLRAPEPLPEANRDYLRITYGLE